MVQFESVLSSTDEGLLAMWRLFHPPVTSSIVPLFEVGSALGWVFLLSPLDGKCTKGFLVLALVGPLKNSQGLDLKPLWLYGSGHCLKGESSTHSQVMGTLEQVFQEPICIWHIHPFLNSDQSPHPCCQEAPPLHDPSSTMLPCRDDISEMMNST